MRGIGIGIGLLIWQEAAHADPARGRQNWVISGEALGRSVVGSLSVDRSLGERWALGGSLGLVGGTPSIGAHANAYLAGEYLAFYITGGVNGYLYSGYTQWFAWPGAGAELRLHSGPTVRAALYMPLWLDDLFAGKSSFSSSAVWVWPGVSLGWCF